MWTSKTLIILLLVIQKLVIGFAFDTNTELLSQILNQDYYLVYNDPYSEIGAERALNNDPLQASETLSIPIENVEWIAYFQVETSLVLQIDAVLLQMPETQVPNGSYKVVIGENPPCPGQSPLAQIAGGVFNCGGQSGEFIKVFCNTPPCGTLRIALIRAWTLTAVSFNATPLLWSPSYQIGTIVQAPERMLENRSLVTNSDIYSFTKEGSFLAPYWAYLAGMKDPHIKALAPVTKAALILQFNYRSQIKEVFFLMSKSQNVSVEVKDTNDYNIVGQGTFCANNQAFNITQTISCDVAGNFMLIWTNDPILYLNKVVVIGWDCGTKPLVITQWSNKAYKILSGTSFISFNFPGVSEGCVASQNKGYNVEYLDEAGNNSLYFITDEILSTSRKIKVMPDAFNKTKFDGKILIVTMRKSSNVNTKKVLNVDQPRVDSLFPIGK